MADSKARSLSAIAEEPTQAVLDPEAVVAEVPAVPPAKMPSAEGDAIPDWAVVPSQLRPPKYKQVVFIRIPAAVTDVPQKGERQCVIWTLSDGEEKLAADRCDGMANRAPAEYTKQMLRAVDGSVVDWGKPKGPGSVDEFWREIGPKGRNLLMRVYTQTHMTSDEEAKDFFENCVAVRTAS